MDGNNQILLITFDVEKRNRKWGILDMFFLSKMKECIRDMTPLAIISERARSTEIPIQDVFPKANHELCCRHLLINMQEKIRK